MEDRPANETAVRVERMLGRRAVGWTQVTTGYADTQRWVVRFADGWSAFVKVGVTEHSRGALRAEARNLEHIDGPFVPRVLAWDDDGREPILVLEDLSDAVWPPPWTPERIEAVLRTLTEVAVQVPPPHALGVERYHADLVGWRRVAGAPEGFLGLGIAGPAWLERALPALIEAEAAATLAGEALVHFDVRSDNMCFPDGRTVLVDWNFADRGNPMLDPAAWAPSLHAEGGPPPESIAPDQPELAALVAGYFAWSAPQAPPDFPGAERIRMVQRRQLGTALPWAARALGLPPPA